MNWKASNLADSFKLWKQKMSIYFSITGRKEEQQVPYILKGADDEGLRRFNTFKLSDEEQKVPKNIWDKFEAQLQVSKLNFRAARLDLHYLHQQKTESLDDFITRIKTKTVDGDFSKAEEAERIIEQILVSTPIPEFQKYILDQPKGVELDKVIGEGRKHEAASHNMKNMREGRGQTSTTETEVHAFKPKAYANAVDEVMPGSHQHARQEIPNVIHVERSDTGDPTV